MEKQKGITRTQYKIERKERKDITSKSIPVDQQGKEKKWHCMIG